MSEPTRKKPPILQQWGWWIFSLGGKKSRWRFSPLRHLPLLKKGFLFCVYENGTFIKVDSNAFLLECDQLTLKTPSTSSTSDLQQTTFFSLRQGYFSSGQPEKGFINARYIPLCCWNALGRRWKTSCPNWSVAPPLFTLLASFSIILTVPLKKVTVG